MDGIEPCCSSPSIYPHVILVRPLRSYKSTIKSIGEKLAPSLVLLLRLLFPARYTHTYKLEQQNELGRVEQIMGPICWKAQAVFEAFSTSPLLTIPPTIPSSRPHLGEKTAKLFTGSTNSRESPQQPREKISSSSFSY